MKVAIIGGGAAGLMAAARIVENSDAKVFVIEKNAILGHKVIISGGGRCNVTTGIEDVKKVLEKYPRGKNFLKFAMYNFSPQKVMRWFEEHDVPLKIEKDLRVFPESDNGKDIVKAFENIFKESGVEVLLRNKVDRIERFKNKFLLYTNTDKKIEVDNLILTTGGQAYRHTGSTGDGYLFAESMGHTITKLAPSLNAFVLEESWIKNLAGVSFKNARIRTGGENRQEFTGAFVFTHKGISGPAVFALSSLAAFELGDFTNPVPIFIDFFPDLNYEELTAKLRKYLEKNPKKHFINTLGFLGPLSLMRMLCADMKIREDKPNMEIAKAEINKAIDWLKNLPLHVNGHAPGEEFVTAGGVDTKEVDDKTMQSKICPGLYFAGEILNVDGFTGGFNLQAAWATGALAGQATNLS